MLPRGRRRVASTVLAISAVVVSLLVIASTTLHGVGYLQLLNELSAFPPDDVLQLQQDTTSIIHDGSSFDSPSTTLAAAVHSSGAPTVLGEYLDVLPSTVSTMSVYYRQNLQPTSLDTLLSPSIYSNLSCEALQTRDALEYATVVSRIAFRRPPSFKMPWYYHDPHPLCGRYLLRHLTASSSSDTAAGSTYEDRTSINSPSQVAPSSSTVGPLSPFLYVVRVKPIIRTPVSAPNHVVVFAVAGVENRDVVVDQCGACVKNNKDEAAGPCENADVLVMARLVGETSVFSASVISAPSSGGMVISFVAWEAGEYVLEVKLVHFRGSSSNASLPRSLGVIGIRASDHNRKSFKYNLACDVQRNAMGSPLRVVVNARDQDAAAAADLVTPTSSASVPFCSHDDSNSSAGRWIRFRTASENSTFHVCPPNISDDSSPYCSGNPTWLSDACGFNDRLLWVPQRCKYRFFSPPHGPPSSCLARKRRGFLLLVGDSVTREYAMNCNLFDLRRANLVCLFNNIALEGQHYSRSYAKDVSQVMINSLKSNKAAVFVTNLGIHHMIGPCSTEMWIELVDAFVETWKREKIQILDVGNDDWLLEKAVWLGPPSIHYARKGMGFQRGQLWDQIAWERLKPLGFRRLYAIAPTLPRVEGTWDGLHYASQRGKVQSPWRNRKAPVLTWNGGVANMLFTMLLNIICY